MKAAPLNLELLRIGVTQTDIARATGVRANFVSELVRGLKRSRKVEAYIIGLLGKKAERHFPKCKRKAAA